MPSSTLRNKHFGDAGKRQVHVASRWLAGVTKAVDNAMQAWALGAR
jgi:hypothetical protein